MKQVLVWAAMMALSTYCHAGGGHDAIVSKDGKVCAAAYDDAIVVNIRPTMRGELAPIVAAIRYAENGGRGREYAYCTSVAPTHIGGRLGGVQLPYKRTTTAG